MVNYNEADNNALRIPDTNKVISEAIIKMVNEPLKPLIKQLQNNLNMSTAMSEAIKAINEPIIQLINKSLPNQAFNVALSKALSEPISQLIKNLQLPKFEINLNNTQAFESEPVSEEVAEKAVELIENTTNLLEENGVDSSQVQELSIIKSKKSFTTSEIITIIIAFISLMFQIAEHFSQKDTTVNNYTQNITINYNNNQEKENESSTLNQTDFNQIRDDLSTLLESLLAPQEDSDKSEEPSENADSPLPEPQVETDTQETTELPTQDNR